MDKKVLVVDDDSLIRKIVSKTLEARGYQLTEAEDGLHALEMMVQEQPDVIVLDIHMLRMNGLELLAALKFAGSRSESSAPRTVTGVDVEDSMQVKVMMGNTQVVMLTSETDPVMAVKALKLGALDYITKPIRPELLVVAVDKAFAQRQLIEDIQEKERHIALLEQTQGIEQLAAGFAHELNQPLQSISNYSTLLRHIYQDQGIGNDELDNSYRSVKESIALQGTLIKAMQLFTQPVHQNMDQDLDVNKAVEGSLLMLRTTLNLQGVSLAVNLLDSLPPVKGSSLFVEQLSINVIVFVLQTLSPTRGLTIRTAYDAENIRVEWEHLAGNEPDLYFASYLVDQESCWEAWYPAFKICRTIAKEHKGSFTVSAEGKTTIFTLFIPLA